MSTSHFEETRVNLGNVSENKLCIVEFNRVDSEPKITHVQASCGCATPRFDNESGKVTVRYTTDYVPVHLRRTVNRATVRKYIQVFFEDGSFEELSFEARIIGGNINGWN